jgi:AcrR family transcriptional regulator
MKKKITKGQKTRERLLQAALQQFSEKGLAGSRVHGIVKEAGLSQASFYLHFKSKEGLYHELLRGFLERTEALVQQATPPSSDPIEMAFHLGQQLIDVFTLLGESPELTRLALNSEEGPQARILLASTIQNNLAKLHETGMARDIDQEMAAEAIVGIVERLTVRWLLTGERTPEELAQGVIEFIYHAVHRT